VPSNAAAVGVEADVMVERPLARGRRGAGEVERAQPARRDLAPHHLDHVRVRPLVRVGDHGGEGGDVHGRIGQRQDRGRDGARVDGRQITLHVDDDVVAAVRVQDLEGFEDAVRAGGVVGAGEHRLPAGARHRLGDGRRVRGHGDRAEAGLDGAAPDMHDHGLAADIGERLVGQARRGKARGDEDDRVGHGAQRRFRSGAA